MFTVLTVTRVEDPQEPSLEPPQPPPSSSKAVNPTVAVVPYAAAVFPLQPLLE